MRTIMLRVDDEDFAKLQSLKKKGESWEAMFLRELKVKEMRLGWQTK